MVLLPNLKKRMQQDIIDGRFDEKMPPIRLLAQMYDVGISTMKLALKQLKDEGFLIGHQGKCIQVNQLAVKNNFFQKNIVLFVNLTRLQQPLYSRVFESLRMTFETNGAYVYLVNSIQQLRMCNFDIDILIAAEIKGDDMQYISKSFSADKIILLNGYSDKFTNVGTDNFKAGYDAVKYLHETKKHTNIGILSIYFDYEWSFNKFRRDGANEYCRQHDDIKICEVDTENFDSVDDAIENLLSQNPEITAIFATMDKLAFNVYKYAAEKNIPIPSKLAVLGFDDSSFCPFTIPALSSFTEDINGITQSLLTLTKNKLMEDNIVKNYFFPPTLIQRESV